jgi:hypothetical protein
MSEETNNLRIKMFTGLRLAHLFSVGRVLYFFQLPIVQVAEGVVERLAAAAGQVLLHRLGLQRLRLVHLYVDRQFVLVELVQIEIDKLFFLKHVENVVGASVPPFRF